MLFSIFFANFSLCFRGRFSTWKISLIKSRTERSALKSTGVQLISSIYIIIIMLSIAFKLDMEITKTIGRNVQVFEHKLQVVSSCRCLWRTPTSVQPLLLAASLLHLHTLLLFCWPCQRAWTQSPGLLRPVDSRVAMMEASHLQYNKTR